MVVQITRKYKSCKRSRMIFIVVVASMSELTSTMNRFLVTLTLIVLVAAIGQADQTVERSKKRASAMKEKISSSISNANVEMKSIAQRAYHHFTAEKKQALLNEFQKCITIKDFDSSIMDQIMQGKFTEDDKTVETIMCAHTNLGYRSQSGKYDIDKVMNELLSDKPDAKQIVEDCENEYGTTTIETAKMFLNCFIEGVLFQVTFADQIISVA